MRAFGKILATSLALVIGAWLLPGIEIRDSLWTVVGVAVLLGIFNSVLKPLLILLTIPITIITFGLFLLAINGIVILIVDALVDGFYVRNFWWALLLSGVISVIQSVVGSFDRDDADYA